MNKKNLIIFILIVVLVIGCGALFLKNNNGNSSSTPGGVSKEIVSPDPVKNSTTYTLAEVGAHSTQGDCWMAIDNNVYDVTSYIASGMHNPEIVRGCGVDATSMFNSERKHSGGEAQDMLTSLKIGILSE